MPINIESVGVPCVRVGASLVTRTLRYIVLTMIVFITVMTSAFVQAPFQVFTLFLCVSVAIWVLTPWGFSKWIFSVVWIPFAWVAGWISYTGQQSAIGVLRICYWFVADIYIGATGAFKKKVTWLWLEMNRPDRYVVPIPFGGVRDGSETPSGYYPWWKTSVGWKVVNKTTIPKPIIVEPIPPIMEQIYDYWYEILTGTTAVLVFKGMLLVISLVAGYIALRSLVRIALIRWHRQKEDFYLFEGEKAVRGSEFRPTESKPSFQASVWVKIDGQWRLSGEGFRSGKYFITAAHVLVSDEIRIMTGTISEEVTRQQFEIMSVDIAVMVLSPQAISKLSLSSARFGPAVEQKFMAEVYAGGYKTLGFVDPFDAFGYVRYNGSTKHGFSGAPYVAGKNTVIGMHLASSGSNVGFDGAFMAAILRSLDEASDDWLLDQVKSGFVKKLQFQQSPVSPDEYMVKVRGKYILCDSEVMNDLSAYGVFPDEQGGLRFEAGDFENAFPAETAQKPQVGKAALMEDEGVPRMHFKQQIQDQGNALRPGNVIAGAIGKSLVNPPLVVLRERKQISPETVSLSAPTPVMEHPVSTHAQPNGPSDITPIASISLGHLFSMTEKERKSLLSLLNTLQDGASMSKEATTGGSKVTSGGRSKI